MQHAAKKVVVITGGTSGLGQAAAIDFAKQGAHVIIVGRDAARAEATRAQASTGGAGAVDVVIGDVSTRAGAKQVAEAILQKVDRIDVLLNNAGGSFKDKATTSDGVEATLALNTLGAFMLERHLHAALAAAHGRIVNVATGFLDRYPLDIADLNGPAKYSSFTQYGRVKQASVMMTVEQSKRLPGVSAVSVHPGIIMGTRFGGGQPKAVQAIFGPLMRAVGVACTLDEAVRRFRVASFDDVPSGSYLANGEVAPLPKQANDENVRGQVWTLLERLAA